MSEMEKYFQPLSDALIILPENTLTNQNRLEFLKDNIEFFYLKQFVTRYPEVSIIVGSEILEQTGKNNSNLSKYNAAVYIDKEGYQITSKSLFVP
ncbi:hypothetical protein FACS1894182_02070 [Bacteroidia bacterium]|nr:hypothetical protein FACS1894182_02070 [Bacteroidia bacterium]